MYFSGWVGSLEQVTIGWDAMSWMASTCLGLAQLSPASCFSSAGVTHARSLAFFGLAPGAGVAAVARGVAVGVAAVGAGFVAAVSADGNPDLGAVVAVPVAFGALVAGVEGLRGLDPVDVG